MTQNETTPLVLAMFTLVCALSAVGAVPTAIAQVEETSLEEGNLAQDIVSNVLDGEDDINDNVADEEIVNQDLTDTSAVINPNQDETVDQTHFNDFGDNTVTNIDADQAKSNVAVSVDEDEDEDGAVWCSQRQGGETVCFNIQKQCELALTEDDELSATSHCERFEKLLPDAFLCVAKEGGISCMRE